MKNLRQRLPLTKMVCDTDSVWSRFILRELDTVKDNNRCEEIKQKGKIKVWEETEWSKFIDVTTSSFRSRCRIL